MSRFSIFCLVFIVVFFPGVSNVYSSNLTAPAPLDCGVSLDAPHISNVSKAKGIVEMNVHGNIICTVGVPNKISATIKLIDVTDGTQVSKNYYSKFKSIKDMFVTKPCVYGSEDTYTAELEYDILGPSNTRVPERSGVQPIPSYKVKCDDSGSKPRQVKPGEDQEKAGPLEKGLADIVLSVGLPLAFLFPKN